MRKFALCAVLLLPVATGGCLAKSAIGVASAPFKIAGQTADWATTSQDEADRNYGRKARKEDARSGRERKKAAAACRRNRDDCFDADGYLLWNE
ncbi:MULTISPECIES: hypothetical protein [unclassified Sphingomonas]|uniref:hypothetical protein n=1 Tax=unclassified Sphingomonas TaxID=196159 RepID=UPI000BD55DB1|nr:MAG: hypothetical protein B7Z43_03125 [Sphingomonas sp. 12-62-6]OYX37626.1 MAG: hypothetical protein B7Y98_11310 [Sphingomonas sp. 32-62-10]OYY64519.1 MAG: hypothetical protein B7Y49_09545 [Sphingomonas sp. 28-62-11]